MVFHAVGSVSCIPIQSFLGKPGLSVPQVHSRISYRSTTQFLTLYVCRIPSGVAHAQEEAGVLRQRLALGRELPVPEVSQLIGV